jgi:hypothetical protein
MYTRAIKGLVSVISMSMRSVCVFRTRLQGKTKFQLFNKGLRKGRLTWTAAYLELVLREESPPKKHDGFRPLDGLPIPICKTYQSLHCPVCHLDNGASEKCSSSPVTFWQTIIRAIDSLLQRDMSPSVNRLTLVPFRDCQETAATEGFHRVGELACCLGQISELGGRRRICLHQNRSQIRLLSDRIRSDN